MPAKPINLSECEIGQPLKFRNGETGRLLHKNYKERQLFRYLVKIPTGETAVTETGECSPSLRPHPYDVVKILPAKPKPAALTRADVQLLKWAQGQAQEMLGAHTGGPHEQEHRDQLARLGVTMKKIKTLVK